MGEAFLTDNRRYRTKALCVLGTLHVFSSIKVSKQRKQPLGEFGFTKRVYHRGAEVHFVIPEFVEEEEPVKRIIYYLFLFIFLFFIFLLKKF